MAVLTTVSLQFDGRFERLEHAIRKAQGIANLWTITIWMKPFETTSVFDQDGNALFEPDGRALLHFKGATHRNEILIWGERIENETSEEYIVVRIGIIKVIELELLALTWPSSVKIGETFLALGMAVI